MTNEQIAIANFLKRKELPISFPCCCLGPKDDDPLCHCAMSWTEKVNEEIYYIFQGDSILEWKAKRVK